RGVRDLRVDRRRRGDRRIGGGAGAASADAGKRRQSVRHYECAIQHDRSWFEWATPAIPSGSVRFPELWEPESDTRSVRSFLVAAAVLILSAAAAHAQHE